MRPQGGALAENQKRDLCNSVPGMRWPPGGSTTGTRRYTSVTAVGFNTFLALLPKMQQLTG